MPLRQFLYGIGMAVLVIGAIFSYASYRSTEHLLASFINLLIWAVFSGTVALVMFTLAKLLENQERIAASQKRIEEKLAKMTIDMD
jgi:hypothetical protein